VKFVPLLQTPPIREGYDVTASFVRAFRSR